MFFTGNKTNFLFPALFALVLTAGALGCVKTDFDEPPTGGESITLTPNTTIKELKLLHVTPKGFDKVTGDLTIKGQVVMDDRSGNYYKTIVIQDETGGIEVKFNDGYLYQQFPVGRTIYIHCQGLLLTDYNGLTQITGSTVEEAGVLNDVGITAAQVRSHVVKGSFTDTPIAPKVVSPEQLNDNLVSTLIQLNDVQFIKADTGKTYADAITKFSLNRTLENCSKSPLLLRTSGYANFANQKTPGGKGTVTGVLGIYNGTYQLYIRDLNDVQLPDARCGAGTPGGESTLNETFDGVTSNQDIDLNGWINVAVQGNRIWRGATFSNNKFASATAFNSSLANMETWLIAPAVDLKTQKTLTFESSDGYYTHDGLTVWVSTNFDGQNVAAATWTQLTFTQPPHVASGYSDFIPSGNIPLPVFNGKGYIGFKYSGNTTANTTTWRFDNVKVQ